MKSNHAKVAFSASLILGSIAILFLFLIDRPAWGQSTVTVSGTVKDNAASPVEGADVMAIDAGTSALVASVLTDSAGYYEMAIPAGTYNFSVIAPVGSGFDNTQSLGQLIAIDTTLNFVLVPSGMETLSGRVLDGLGVGMPNQGMRIWPEGGGSNIDLATDSTGNYAFHVAPGNYWIYLYGSFPGTLAGPGYYSLYSSVPISLDADTVMDIPLPVKRVTVHVQDPGGTGVAGVTLATNVVNTYVLTMGSLAASGSSMYRDAPLPVTDAAGNVTLWLFPTDPAHGLYAFTATPPEGSPYGVTSLSGITVSGDTAVTIELAVAVTLSGRVLDGLGVGMPNQGMRIWPEGGGSNIDLATDSTGNYAFHVAPGNYWIYLYGSFPGTLAGPGYYSLYSFVPISLDADTVMDIPLPVKRVTVHVQDPGGTGVAGVTLATNEVSTYVLTMGSLAASGSSMYRDAPLPVTDAAGNVTLWLFPTDPAHGLYAFTATPPEDNPFATFYVQDVTVATDMTVVVVLQYAVRKDDLLGTWDGQGVYYRNSDTGAWVKLASPATKIAVGDLDGDDVDDLVGLWPGQGGIWVKYSQSGAWAKLSSTAQYIAAGDMNGDGREDLVGTWDGQGVFYRDSISGTWVRMASEATMVTTGDIDGDGTDDLIGLWPAQGGIWVKYSQSGAWARLSSTAVHIASGDMNGDERDDLVGTWDGQGVFYRDSITGAWVKMASPATLITTGDLDGDVTDDLIGIWPTQGGVWVKYSMGGAWARMSSTAVDIAAGIMRVAEGGAAQAAGATEHDMSLQAAPELPLPIGGEADGPGVAPDKRDFSDRGPGGARFVYLADINLEPREEESARLTRIPGPGEPGFVGVEQKNIFPEEAVREKRRASVKKKKIR